MAERAPLDAVAGEAGPASRWCVRFLGIAKARLIAACEDFGWWHVRDPANHEFSPYPRARLRALLPALAQERPHGVTPDPSGAARKRDPEALDHAGRRFCSHGRVSRACDGALTLDGAGVLRDAPVANRPARPCNAPSSPAAGALPGHMAMAPAWRRSRP